MVVKFLNRQAVVISGAFFKTAALRDEPYEIVEAPGLFISQMKREGMRADLFTFMQAMSETKPMYDYHLEWHSLAILRIATYEDWWKKQIKDKTRNMVRKAQKAGVKLALCEFNDDFVRGIMSIYNECPLRQGKPFKHYGKDFDTVKREHETFLERSDFIGAWHGGELIGFAKLVHGENVSSLMQIISKIAFRDKSPTNALIAKAVEICAARNVQYLHYGIWSRQGLGEFKRYHGFARCDIPRYFVPLNLKGEMMLKLKLHRKALDFIPEKWLDRLVVLRNRWNLFRYKLAGN